jgi:hypothetical protein
MVECPPTQLIVPIQFAPCRVRDGVARGYASCTEIQGRLALLIRVIGSARFLPESVRIAAESVSGWSWNPQLAVAASTSVALRGLVDLPFYYVHVVAGMSPKLGALARCAEFCSYLVQAPDALRFEHTDDDPVLDHLPFWI